MWMLKLFRMVVRFDGKGDSDLVVKDFKERVVYNGNRRSSVLFFKNGSFVEL